MSTTENAVAVAVPSQTTAQALAALLSMAQQAAGAEFKDVSLVREGAQIIIPEDMTIDDAQKWLTRKKQEEEQVVAISEVVDANPFEGAYAFAKAIARTFGFSSLVPTPGFFGQKHPPTMVGVEVNAGEFVRVPWGRMEIPKLEGFLATGWDEKDGRYVFAIRGEVKQKHRGEVAKLADLTREIVKTESLYRGKAIRVQFQDKGEEPDWNNCPRFMETGSIRPEELIFADDVNRKIKTNLFTPIVHTQQCRDNGVPLKRGVLLAGPYGTGKTLTAHVAAKLCVDNGWTFIYLADVAKLEQAIHFSKSYQPALIFAEDIDQVMGGDRDEDEEMNEILNTIDGVDTKGSEIVVVLTTNFLENIDVAMLRAGRLDAIIEVNAPDAKAAMKLVQLYARGLLSKTDDFTTVGEKLSGVIPAFIREVVERSKLGAIARAPEAGLTLRAVDLEHAADEILAHIALMTEEEEDERPDVVKAADVIAQAMHKANGNHLTEAAS